MILDSRLIINSCKPDCFVDTIKSVYEFSREVHQELGEDNMAEW